MRALGMVRQDRDKKARVTSAQEDLEAEKRRGAQRDVGGRGRVGPCSS